MIAIYIYKILFKTSVPENTRESSYTISWIYTSSSISLNEGGCQRPFTGWCCSKQTGPRHGTPEMARLPVDRQVDCWTDQGVTRLVASQGRPERSIHPRSPTGQPLRLDPTLNGLRTPRRTAARAAPPNAPNGSSGPRSRPRGRRKFRHLRVSQADSFYCKMCVYYIPNRIRPTEKDPNQALSIGGSGPDSGSL